MRKYLVEFKTGVSAPMVLWARDDEEARRLAVADVRKHCSAASDLKPAEVVAGVSKTDLPETPNVSPRVMTTKYTPPKASFLAKTIVEGAEAARAEREAAG